MSSSKKYEYQVEQSGKAWSAKITRKISSKKRTTTKEQAGFESESDAIAWAESALTELTSKQRSSNDSQLQKRKENEEIKRLRSERRATKTEQAKLEAAAAIAAKAELAELEDSLTDEEDTIESWKESMAEEDLLDDDEVLN